MLRVATLRSCASAEAAIRLSLIGMERPLAFNRARSLAQTAPVGWSKSTTLNRSQPAANHSSSRRRFRPGGRSRIPYSISPRTIGLTAMPCSFWRSQFKTLPSGCGLVGSLRTLESTRNFTRNRLIRIRFPETSPYPDKPAASQQGRHWFLIPAAGKDIPRLPTSEWRSAALAKPDPAS